MRSARTGVTAALTAAAMVAFAGNSLLCRMALGRGAIDAATFSSVRFTVGAATLFIVSSLTRSKASPARGSWASAAVLFLYAIAFSFAYLSLTAGTGALILFGSVQITMMVAALRSGERPRLVQWLGLALALAGLVYLVLPGLTAPPAAGAALMTLAGIAWGAYSLAGRRSVDPLAQTSGNFLRTVPLVLGASLLFSSRAHAEPAAVLLAMVSGALATGLGYVAWFAALSDLSATRAAAVQLTVPVLAGAGGTLLLGETLTGRLVLSAAIVLGGIALTLVGRERPVAGPSTGV